MNTPAQEAVNKQTKEDELLQREMQGVDVNRLMALRAQDPGLPLLQAAEQVKGEMRTARSAQVS